MRDRLTARVLVELMDRSGISLSREDLVEQRPHCDGSGWIVDKAGGQGGGASERGQGGPGSGPAAALEAAIEPLQRPAGVAKGEIRGRACQRAAPFPGPPVTRPAMPPTGDRQAWSGKRRPAVPGAPVAGSMVRRWSRPKWLP
jgi:hypothetical protein